MSKAGKRPPKHNYTSVLGFNRRKTVAMLQTLIAWNVHKLRADDALLKIMDIFRGEFDVAWMDYRENMADALKPELPHNWLDWFLNSEEAKQLVREKLFVPHNGTW